MGFNKILTYIIFTNLISFEVETTSKDDSGDQTSLQPTAQGLYGTAPA